MTDPKRARCYDKDWHYTPKDATDVGALFKRIRRQQKLEAGAAKARPAKPIPIIHAERIKGAK